MGRTRPAYPLAYRQRVIELFRAGHSIEDLANDFEPCAKTIRIWIRQAGLDDSPASPALRPDEKAELQRLRRENRALREEREILRKAAAWVCHEQRR